MKKCPYCAEDIQDAAIKCRYCGEMLPSTQPPAPIASSTAAIIHEGPLESPPFPPSPQASSPKRWSREWLLELGFFSAGRGPLIGGIVIAFGYSCLQLGASVFGFLSMWIGATVMLKGLWLMRLAIGFLAALVLLVVAVGINPPRKTDTRIEDGKYNIQIGQAADGKWWVGRPESGQRFKNKEDAQLAAKKILHDLGIARNAASNATPTKEFTFTAQGGEKIMATTRDGDTAKPLVLFSPFLERTDGNLYNAALNSLWNIYGKNRGFFQLQDAQLRPEPSSGGNAVCWPIGNPSGEFCVFPTKDEQTGAIAGLTVWIQ